MSSSPAVIDAGIAILRVIDTPTRPLAVALWDQFSSTAAQLWAPQLWCYEVASVVHRYLFDGTLTAADTENALKIILDFGVELVNPDEKLCLAALRWATRLRQRPAYDGFYLALAERLGAQFWTTDQRLCNNARQAGSSWVHCLAEVADRTSTGNS